MTYQGSRLRRKAEILYRKYRALLVLTNSLDKSERRRLDETISTIPDMPRRLLQQGLPGLERKVEGLASYYGLRGSVEKLEELTEISDDKYPMLYVTKLYLQDLLTRYDRVLPNFSDFPSHARIGIELKGVEEKGKIEVFVLEASLFEDMAALWNLTWELERECKQNFNKELYKRVTALSRASAKAAFNLVEGYLNGMASDILAASAVTAKHRLKLREWDEDLSRAKLLSLRDKILQYPKIAIGAQDPPLDEGNCPVIKNILELEQKIRHSLIHPTPQHNPGRSSHYREGIYYRLETEEVADLCDSVVELIFKLNAVIGEKHGKVSPWLFPRGSDGKFPAEAFT